MRLLLDTHAFIWWVNGSERLARRARRAIDDDENVVLVSAVSAWEISTKYHRGRLDEAVAMVPDIPGAIADQDFEELPITVEEAARAGALPDRSTILSTACSSPRRSHETSCSSPTNPPSTTTESAASGEARPLGLRAPPLTSPRTQPSKLCTVKATSPNLPPAPVTAETRDYAIGDSINTIPCQRGHGEPDDVIP